MQISVFRLYRAVENVQQKLVKTKEDLKERLDQTHPVRSRIGPWMRDRLRIFEVELNSHKAISHYSNLNKHWLAKIMIKAYIIIQ